MRRPFTTTTTLVAAHPLDVRRLVRVLARMAMRTLNEFDLTLSASPVPLRGAARRAHGSHKHARPASSRASAVPVPTPRADTLRNTGPHLPQTR